MISCQLYDYLEISCMYKLPIEVQLKDGKVYQGVIADIKINQQGQEYFVLSSKDEVLPELLLTDLKMIRAQVWNPHFEKIDFSE
jgi:Rho-binding antiterminator